jgi:hypothetical protein
LDGAVVTEFSQHRIASIVGGVFFLSFFGCCCLHLISNSMDTQVDPENAGRTFLRNVVEPILAAG